MTMAMRGYYADGQWRQTQRTFADLNPSDGSVWAEVPDLGAVETQAAIQMAHSAFGAWAEQPFSHRGHLLLKIADEIERRRDDLIAAIRAEGGGWFGKGMFEASYVPEVFRAAGYTTAAWVARISIRSESMPFRSPALRATSSAGADASRCRTRSAPAHRAAVPKPPV